MKMTFEIAKTELRNLFYSPVAWFLTLVFMVICAVFFFAPFEMYLTGQDIAQRNIPGWAKFDYGLTAPIMLNPDSIITNVFSNLFLFIPLLTMGIINREFNNGTVKLLYSSPVKLYQMVWGKYLAIMIYNMMLLAILSVFVLIGTLSIRDFDLGWLLGSLIAFYLLVCAYTAIGMFMSSLTTYQIVSAIGTFILLFVLMRVGALWQEYDFVRDLTWFLSLNGRTAKMVGGLITTRDVMYYVLITAMFITFTMLKLRHGRESVSKLTKTLRYVGVFLVVLTIGYFTSRPGYVGYWDSTATQKNTASENTQEIIKTMLDEPLEVTLYTNLLGNGAGPGLPASRNGYIWGFWETYFRFKPNINFKYVYYYDKLDGDTTTFRFWKGKSLKEIAVEYSKLFRTDVDLFMPPEEIRKQIDLQPEGLRTVMLLKYKGRTAFLRTFNDNQFWPGEDIVAATLKRLSQGDGPKVYVSAGNLERNIYKTGEREFAFSTTYKQTRTALINQGYEIDTVNLQYRDIPADATAFMLTDPKIMLSETVTNRLKDYVGKGGNMLIMGEPGKQEVLNPVLKYAGAKLMPGTIVQISENEMPHMVNPYFTYPFIQLFKKRDGKIEAIHKYLLKGDSTSFLHPGTAPVALTDSVSGFKMIPLLTTTRSGHPWVKVGKMVVDSAAPVFATNEGDYKMDDYNVAIGLSRQVGQKEQRVVVVGDADNMSNIRSTTQFLGLNYMAWLHNEAFHIRIPTLPDNDNLFLVSLKTGKLLRTVFTWILPAAVLIFGTILLIRRKRK